MRTFDILSAEKAVFEPESNNTIVSIRIKFLSNFKFIISSPIWFLVYGLWLFENIYPFMRQGQYLNLPQFPMFDQHVFPVSEYKERQFHCRLLSS